MTTMWPDRREQGSEFHLPSYPSGASDPAPWNKNGMLFGSGCDAMRALLSFSMNEYGWKRLWVPSYFCQHVVSSFMSTGIDVRAYPDGPGQIFPELDRIDAEPGDVAFVVNFFGLRTKPPIYKLDRSVIKIIEDHTHDPWSKWAWESDADWCTASLRKTLPIPDGGVIWSPTKQPMPPKAPVTNNQRKASLEKLASMVLKSLYLEGHAIKKETFRSLAVSGEERFGKGAVSGMPEWTADLLATLPVSSWRERRSCNHRILSKALAGIPWLTVLQPDNLTDVCPFSGILVFDSPKRRDYVHQKLLDARLYPAILWPLDRPVIEGIQWEYIDFSSRILSIHCDMRYDESEIQHTASLIRSLES